MQPSESLSTDTRRKSQIQEQIASAMNLQNEYAWVPKPFA